MATTTATATATSSIVFRYTSDDDAKNKGEYMTNDTLYFNILSLYTLAKELRNGKYIHPEVKKVLKKHIALHEKAGVIKLINFDTECYNPPCNQELDKYHHELHGLKKYVLKTDLALFSYVLRFFAFEMMMRQVNGAKCPCCATPT